MHVWKEENGTVICPPRYRDGSVDWDEYVRATANLVDGLEDVIDLLTIESGDYPYPFIFEE